MCQTFCLLFGLTPVLKKEPRFLVSLLNLLLSVGCFVLPNLSELKCTTPMLDLSVFHAFKDETESSSFGLFSEWRVSPVLPSCVWSPLWVWVERLTLTYRKKRYSVPHRAWWTFPEDRHTQERKGEQSIALETINSRLFHMLVDDSSGDVWSPVAKVKGTARSYVLNTDRQCKSSQN